MSDKYTIVKNSGSLMIHNGDKCVGIADKAHKYFESELSKAKEEIEQLKEDVRREAIFSECCIDATKKLKTAIDEGDAKNIKRAVLGLSLLAQGDSTNYLAKIQADRVREAVNAIEVTHMTSQTKIYREWLLEHANEIEHEVSE